MLPQSKGINTPHGLSLLFTKFTHMKTSRLSYLTPWASELRLVEKSEPTSGPFLFTELCFKSPFFFGGGYMAFSRGKYCWGRSGEGGIVLLGKTVNSRKPLFRSFAALALNS